MAQSGAHTAVCAMNPRLGPVFTWTMSQERLHEPLRDEAGSLHSKEQSSQLRQQPTADVASAWAHQGTLPERGIEGGLPDTS